MKRLWQAIGSLVSVLGIASLIEASRLQQYKAAFGFGAGTFPFILGVALIVLGVYLAVSARRDSKTELTWPHGQEAVALLATFATLVLYCALIPLLGYATASFFASAALFRIIGGYPWFRSVLGGAVTTGLLYVVFEYVAGLGFPSGLIG